MMDSLNCHIEWRIFSGVGNVAHALSCLQYWQPMVGNIGTFGTDGRVNGAIVQTLNGIGM